MDNCLLWHGAVGERYLFVRPFWLSTDLARRREFRDFKPLPALAGRRVAAQLLDSQRGMLWRLYRIAYGWELTASPDFYQVRRRLIDGVLENGQLAVPSAGHYQVLRWEPPRLELPPEPCFELPELYKPAPLAETQSWVAVECVAEGEDQTPVRGVEIEIITAAGLVYRTATDDRGMAFFERIAPGRVIIRVLGRDGSSWRPVQGEPARPSADGASARVHVVRQGEYVSKIAHEYGLARWQDIWQHPKNEALRKRRQSPNVLYPGDPLIVPAAALNEIVRTTEQTYRLEIRREAKVRVRMHLLDERRKTIPSGTYEICASGATVAAGDFADGQLEAELPVSMQDAVLVVRVGKREVKRPLQLGFVDPAAETSGVQGRLANLGYFEEQVDGRQSAALDAALLEFREDAGLTPDSKVDDDLREALTQTHKA